MIKIAKVIVCMFLVAVWIPPVSAQIVNPLRGFDDKEPGWSGGVESAIAIADGNTDYFEFEISGALQHQGEHNRWRLLGHNQRRTAFGTEIAESRMAHIRHNYRVSSWLASIVFLQAQYDPFKRIETRLLAGTGARFILFEGAKSHTDLGATVMLENEELTDRNNIDNTTDVRFSFFLSVFRDVSEGVDVDLVGFYQPRVDRLGDDRADIAASLRTDIVGQLYAVLKYKVEYDSTPPVGVEDLDQNFRAGLGVNF